MSAWIGGTPASRRAEKRKAIRLALIVVAVLAVLCTIVVVSCIGPGLDKQKQDQQDRIEFCNANPTSCPYGP